MGVERNVSDEDVRVRVCVTVVVGQPDFESSREHMWEAKRKTKGEGMGMHGMPNQPRP